MTADNTVQNTGDVDEPTGKESTGEDPTGTAVETDTDPAAESDARAPESDDAPATSPALDHLDDTIKEARQAADQALAPQRDE